MFERLARQEERENTEQTKNQDVFQEATEEEIRRDKQSQPSETAQTSLPVNNQVTSSTEVNGEARNDVEMQEDGKGGVIC